MLMSGCGPGSMLADVFNDEVMAICARGEEACKLGGSEKKNTT